MPYTVDYCVSQVNGCRRTLGTLNEDLTKLKSIIKIIADSKVLYDVAFKELEKSKKSLFNGFDGITAKKHYSKMKKIIEYFKEDESSIMAIQSDTSKKQIEIEKKISSIEGDLYYWEHQLDIARTEASND